MVDKVMFSSGSSEWGTPKELFDDINRFWGPFTLDAAATEENSLCDEFFDKKVDGLTAKWRGRAFCNPPYGRGKNGTGPWVMKAYNEVQLGRVDLAVLLIPARTDTAWWHDYVMQSHAVYFIRGRVSFVGGDNSAPFPSAIVVFMKRDALETFGCEFSSWEQKGDNRGPC